MTLPRERCPYNLERAAAATILRYHTAASLFGVQRLLEPMVSRPPLSPCWSRTAACISSASAKMR